MYQNMLTATSKQSSEKVLISKKQLLTSYKKLAQLNSSQATSTSHYTQAFRTPKA